MKFIFKIAGVVLAISFFLILGRRTIVWAGVYGDSPQVDFSAITVPTCTNFKPKAPILLEPNHPLLPRPKNRGELVLVWHKVPGASSYTVVYGLTPGNYIYGAANIGNGDSERLDIRGLANRIYYFAVRANNGCMPGPFSNEWKARPALGGWRTGDVLGVATGFVPAPQIAKVQKQEIDTTVVELNPTPVEIAAARPTKASVRGISDQFQPPARSNTGGKAPMAAQQPKPQSQGFFSSILSAIGKLLFGK